MDRTAATDSTQPSDAARDVAGELVRDGAFVRLRTHVVANRPAFQRWYADEEIAKLLRHDQLPLNSIQSRGYFDTIIMPLSARGMCYAIHEIATDRLIGTTAITDLKGVGFRSGLFRIVIGEKDCWGKGYGTEATRLVIEEAFGTHNLDQVRLEVFQHNERALAAHRRVGFREAGNHVEFVGRARFELHVIEMELDRQDYEDWGFHHRRQSNRTKSIRLNLIGRERTSLVRTFVLLTPRQDPAYNRDMPRSKKRPERNPCAWVCVSATDRTF